MCRLEELKLTGANEDETKRFTILRAMCSILENGREDDEHDTFSLTNPSQSRCEESLASELAMVCKRSFFLCFVVTNRTVVQRGGASGLRVVQDAAPLLGEHGVQHSGGQHGDSDGGE